MFRSKNKKMRKLLLCFCLCFSGMALFAQSVVVNVQVLPPFSNYLSVYLDNPNKVVVTLQNTGRSAVDIKLKASLEGDNGVKIYTNDAFNPPAAKRGKLL